METIVAQQVKYAALVSAVLPIVLVKNAVTPTVVAEPVISKAVVRTALATGMLVFAMRAPLAVLPIVA